jgi:hypothetical protein
MFYLLSAKENGESEDKNTSDCIATFIRPDFILTLMENGN